MSRPRRRGAREGRACRVRLAGGGRAGGTRLSRPRRRGGVRTREGRACRGRRIGAQRTRAALGAWRCGAVLGSHSTMTTTDERRRRAAKAFVERWTFRRGSEKGEDQQFWNDLLRSVLGVEDVESRIWYQVPMGGSPSPATAKGGAPSPSTPSARGSVGSSRATSTASRSTIARSLSCRRSSNGIATASPVRTPRAEGGAGTSRAGPSGCGG